MKNETNGNIIVKVIDQGDIDERVVRTVRNIYGLLRSIYIYLCIYIITKLNLSS